MPEGHSVHRDADRLHAAFAGRRVTATSPQGRFGEGAAAVDGRVVERVEAYGKHLLLDLDTSLSVHVHYALAGRWVHLRGDEPPPGARLHLRTADDGDGGRQASWALVAPRVCELVDAAGRAAVLARLGPDPLRPRADAAEAVLRLRGHRGTVAAAVMDQACVAGVGNVFRAEVLYRARLDPRQRAREVPVAAYEDIWRDLVTLLRRGLRLGRIVTVDGGNARTPVDRARYVYKQPACLACGAPVRTWTDTGRTVYACAVEQLGEPAGATLSAG